MSVTRPPRWLTIAPWLSVGLAVAVCFGLWPLTGGDLLMHLVVGRWSWQHGGPPLTDVFSYVSADEPFIAHSWLAEVLFYLIESSAGTIGFLLLRLALISGALLCAGLTARALGATLGSVLLVLPLVLTVMRGRLEFRPQLFTTAFLAFELLLLISVHTGQRSPRWLWTVPPLFTLWINLYGGWPQGVLMLIAALIAVSAMEARWRWLGHGLLSELRAWPLALVLGACALVLLVNPYGWRLVTFPLEMQADRIRAIGPEWQNPFTSGTMSGGRWISGWSLVGGCLFMPTLIKLTFIAYLALLGGVLLAQARRWCTADLLPCAVIAFWGVFACYHLRAVSDATLLTAPLVAAWLGSTGRVRRQWPVWVGTAGVLALTVLAEGLGVRDYRRNGDWRWTCGFPVCTEAEVRRLGLSGRVFDLISPHWVLWAFHPAMTVDGTHGYVGGERHSVESLAVRTGRRVGGQPIGMDQYADQYRVSILMMPNRTFHHVPGWWARGWVLVHGDDRAYVMVRQPTALPIYRHVRPWENAPVTPSNAPAVLQEANRALAECPDGATFAWAYKAEALRLLGRHRASFEAALKVPERLVIE